MEEVNAYVVLQSEHAKELQAMVNEKIEQGWQPHGGLVYSDLIWAQAMVKRVRLIKKAA